MVNNRPTPDRVFADSLADEFPMAVAELHATAPCSSPPSPAARTRRNPSRDARRRPAREKGRRDAGCSVNRASSRPRSRPARASSPITLNKTGLQPYLDQLGFKTVGYGCTTCIGNSGPLDPRIEEAITKNDLVARQRALRQPQFRGARAPEHQGELPHVAAARRRLRARGPRRHRPDQRAARHAGRTARTSS